MHSEMRESNSSITSWIGKLVSFLSAFVVVYSVPPLVGALWRLWASADGGGDRHLVHTVSYLIVLVAIGCCGLAAGVLLLFKQRLLAAFFLVLSAVIAVFGLPDG